MGASLVLGCHTPKDEPEFKLDFTVEKFDLVNGAMEVAFVLSNMSDYSLHGEKWSLHWNQIMGVIDPSTLPEGIEFEWVNGNSYFVLHFDEQWPLGAGETVSFKATQKGIMAREAMGPVGVFGVFDGNTFDVSSSIHWEDAEGLADLKLPTAHTRFNQYSDVYKIPIDSLQWVVPSASEVVGPSGFRAPSEIWSLFLSEELEKHRSRLDLFFKNGRQKIRWTKDVERANVIIQSNTKFKEEAYQLIIDKKAVQISTNSYGGIVYAIRSLEQIAAIAAIENSGWPLMELHDAPRFVYRGFLLDIARNFYGLDKIKQIIDLMSLFKLNHLDLKLTDDEGWRLEIPGLPELTDIGSNRGYTTSESDRLIPMYGSGADGGTNGNGYLSKEDFIELLTYASARNIHIIPQISFPSHARAAVVSMEARRQNFLKQGKPGEAEKYALKDPIDQSEYRSAQLYNDNTINICKESAYVFFEKVVSEVVKMYEMSGLPLKQMSIGADEVPYGAWQQSPLCDSFLDANPNISSYADLYDQNVHKLKNILDNHGIKLSGWEDFLLEHSEKSQAETQIKYERYNYEVIPYVWNSIWKGGREDMIYKFANLGFQTVMSNSSAYYFDMVDDADMENHGLSWSGYVDYFDTWALDPEDIFANHYINSKHQIDSNYINNKIKLDPTKRENLLGIQSQLFSETARNEAILDKLLMPNLIFFAERAWAPRPHWVSLDLSSQQRPMFADWHLFLNTVGQRIWPMVAKKHNPQMGFDIPKPGGVLVNDTLKVHVPMPGLKVRYTLDGSVPSNGSVTYLRPVYVGPNQTITLRAFDAAGRGGNPIRIGQ